MAMSPRLILGYLHHAQAVGAIERLESIYDRALPHVPAREQKRELERLRRVANGETPPTPEQERAVRQAHIDANWNALRQRLPSTGKKLLPGERVIIPEDL